MGMLDNTDNYRIQALQEDVRYFRGLLNQAVQQSTDSLGLRTPFTNSSNPKLDSYCQKKHKKYIDQLNKTQAREAALYLRSLESELSKLTKGLPSDVATSAVNTV